MTALADRRARPGESAGVAAYPGFDWLRFVLASVVALDHGGFRFLPFLTGTLAVQIFFALSGWLIGGILLRTDAAGLPRFFHNRATRIWIPYAFAVLLLYGVAALKDGIDVFWFKYLLLDVTFTHQLYTFFPAAHFEMPMAGTGHHFWSIAVEEQFYLLAPLVMLFAPKGRSVWIWLPAAMAMMALGWHGAPIALGVVCAILQRDFGLADRTVVRWGAAAVAAGIAAAMSQGADPALLSSPFAAAVVVALARPGRRSAVALTLGGLSYPLYLNHWTASFIVHFLARRGFPGVDDVPIYYLVALLIGWALYRLIDLRIQRHRDAWFTPARGRRLAVIAYALVSTGVALGAAVAAYGPHGAVPAGHVEKP